MTSAPRPDDSGTTSWPAADIDVQDRDGDDVTSVTRSEQQLSVSTIRVPVTRVRLRKRIVTETRTVTIQVSREELVVDHEPFTGSDGEPTEQNAPPAPQELEIILHEQRPVITMETVAVERILVRTHTATEEQTITETIGKEQIELHHDPVVRTTIPAQSGRHPS